MNFSVTKDIDFILKCNSYLETLKMSESDNSPDIDLYFPVIDDKHIYINVNGKSLYSLIYLSEGVYDVHISLHKSMIGHGAFISRMLAKWVNENLPFVKKCRMSIPEFNTNALLLMQSLGINSHGLSDEKFVRNGDSFDMFDFEFKI